MGYIWAMGPCCNCHTIFSFNPERVPSVRIKNGVPAADGIRQAVCRPCVTTWNAKRRAAGAEPIPILPGAYEPADEYGGLVEED
jgi:hypothetical protein